MTRAFLVLIWTSAVLASSSPLQAQPAIEPGQPLAEALRAIQASGVRIVFSSELVRPDMQVKTRPQERDTERLLKELLRPHGLEIRRGPGNTWLVVATRNARRSAPAKTARVSGAPRHAIAGRVVDAQSGEPLGNVLVRLEGDQISATTGDDGRFRLEVTTSGTQTLSVSTVGYALVRRTVDVNAAAAAELIVPLAPGTGAYTEHVTVPSEPRDAGGKGSATRTLDSRELQDLGTVVVDDPFRAVQALPGVAWNDDFRAELSVRALGPAHVGVSIDDVPTPWLVHTVVGRGQDTGSVALINGDIIDRIELLPGVHPQRLGDRTGAWLETTIREGSREAVGVRGAISAASASIVTEGPIGRSQRGSWLVSLRQSYLDWLLRRVTAEDDQSIFGFTDGQIKLAADVTPRRHVELTMVGGRSRLDEDNETPGPNSLAEGTARTGLVTVGLRSTLTPSLVTSQRVWLTGQRFENLGVVGQDLATGSFGEIGVRSDVSWSPGSRSLVEIGGDLAWRDELLVVRQYGSSPAGRPVVAFTNSADGATSAQSAYANVQWSGPAGMSIAPGVRLTHASIIDDTTVSPWVVVGWRGGPGLRARVAAAIQHQAPDVAQVFGSGGNPALVAARSRSFEASIGRGWDRWQWDIGVFNRQDRDYLRQIGTETRRSGAFILPGNPLGQWENALHGSTYGVEATLSRHVAQGWGGWLAYSYGKNTYTDPSRGEQFPGDFDQRHAVVMYTFYQLSARTRASARVRLGSNFPIPGYLERAGGGTLRVSDVRNRVRLPEYARLDLNVSRAFFWSNRRLTLFAEVLNATDRANYRASNNGTIRTRTGEALGFLEQLFPLLPGVGLLIEF